MATELPKSLIKLRNIYITMESVISTPNRRIKFKILYQLMIDFLFSEEGLNQMSPALRKLLKSQIHRSGEYSYDFFSTFKLNQEEAEGIDNSLDNFAEEIFDLLINKFHFKGPKLGWFEYNRLKRDCITSNTVSHYHRVQNLHNDFREVRLKKSVAIDLMKLSKLIKAQESPSGSF